MVKIKAIDGTKKDIKCIGCALQKGIIKTEGGILFGGKYFEIRQDYEVPIPGLFVIASKRHITGFHDFNEKEKKEFINLICKVRKGMKVALKIKYITLLFREDTIISKTNPSHFHIALLPKYSWMNRFSNVNDILGYARKKMKTRKNLKRVSQAANKLKKLID